MKKNLCLSVLLFCMACASKERETFAHITQRRLDTAGKLLISYQFRDGDSIVYDSVEVPNQVIPHDSVKVVFTPGHPGDSRLVLP